MATRLTVTINFLGTIWCYHHHHQHHLNISIIISSETTPPLNVNRLSPTMGPRYVHGQRVFEMYENNWVGGCLSIHHRCLRWARWLSAEESTYIHSMYANQVLHLKPRSNKISGAHPATPHQFSTYGKVCNSSVLINLPYRLNAVISTSVS